MKTIPPAYGAGVALQISPAYQGFPGLAASPHDIAGDVWGYSSNPIVAADNLALVTRAICDSRPTFHSGLLGAAIDTFSHAGEGLSLEDEVARLWRPDGRMSEIRAHANRWLDRVAKGYSLVAMAPHHIYEIPIDADSFVVAAVMSKAIRSRARALSRDVEFIADPSEASDDRLYALMFPISHYMQAYTDEDWALLDMPNIAGSRAMMIGDAAIRRLHPFTRRGDFGFDSVMIQDHHGWTTPHMAYALGISDEQVLAMNNGFLLRSAHKSSYSSGAFYADLLGDGSRWYGLAKRLSLVGDGYHMHFPNMMSGVNVDLLESIAEELAIVGCFLLNWNADDTRKRAAISQLALTMADSESFPAMKRNIDEGIGGLFGAEYARFRSAVSKEVDRSIKTFLESDDEFFVYRMGSDYNMIFLVHKMVNARLKKEELFGDRVFAHFALEHGNHVHMILARGADGVVNLGEVCRCGPNGAVWGGGHVDRAGFSTVYAADKIMDWWGEEMDSQRVLDFVRQRVKADRLSV